MPPAWRVVRPFGGDTGGATNQERDAENCRRFALAVTAPLIVALARLTDAAWCLTLYNMKTATLTIRLDEDLNDLLTDASRSSGRNRSEVAREALRRQLRLSQFESLRRRIMPLAEARGFLTDEDVFSQVS